MPLNQNNVFARSGAQGATTKQSPRYLLVLVNLFALLLSACGVQATPFPQITQESLPINSSVDVVASTRAPAGVWIGDSVPTALREQVLSWDIPAHAALRLDISSTEL